MLRKIRIALATLVMLLVTLLFLDFTGTLQHYFAWVAKIQFLPALLALNFVVVAVLIVLTLIFGRIYCSVVCPLGIMQDMVSSLNRKRNHFSYSPALRKTRYAVLFFFIIFMIIGWTAIASLIAPYSSFGRMAQNLLQPIYIFGNNILAAIAEHFNSYAFYSRDVWMRSLPTFLIALATFIIIAVLAYRNGRTYCNVICPVGTVLSFFARFSWFRIYIDTSKCRTCGKCSRNCKASCIDSKNHKVDLSRCVACGNCLEHCEFSALKYGHPHQKVEPQPAASGRRAFLLGTALATAGSAIAQEKKKVDGGLAQIEDKQAPKRRTPLTPPGSLSAENLQQHCTACQLCVSKCPNDVLRPSTSLEHLMQPTMSYERGYCRPECNTCSEVCPTGAIKPITLADKSSTQIGHAVWIRKNCIAITDKVECGNCARHCPSGAIMMIPQAGNEDGPMIPAVNMMRCIGCGACENVCPARPFSAIYVEGHEVHREV